MNRLVSIIIPVYNAEKYLKESLESVFNQTYKNIEIIAINDGSTDQSSQILREFAPKLKIITQPNKGQCAALNAGIAICNGDYIKFFDADDIMNPEHIESQVSALKANDNSVAKCDWLRFYDTIPTIQKNSHKTKTRKWKPNEWLKHELAKDDDMVGGPLWLIPRNVLLRTGLWDERLSVNNDFEFTTRLLANCEQIIDTSSAILFYRTAVPGSLSLRKSPKSLEALVESNLLGVANLLCLENSVETKLIAANRLRRISFSLFPHNRSLVKRLDKKIIELGGSNIKLKGGFLLTLLTRVFGWRCARIIQVLFYKIGYKPNKPSQ